MYHIVFATDDNYSQHLGACLASLFENNRHLDLCAHVFENGISRENREKLESIALDYNQDICFTAIDSTCFESFPTLSYYSVITWFRLKLADYISEDIDRVLYLDCDTVVCGDLKPLFDIDLQGYPLAAVEDTPWQVDFSVKSGIMPKGGHYFNAGVLLIQMSEFRTFDNYRKAKELLSSGVELRFLDQDVLNAIFLDKWLRLPEKWNVLNGFLRTVYQDGSDKADAYVRAAQERVIVHFSASEKPWSWRCYNPFRNEYYKYLSKTPWKGFRPHRTWIQSLANIKNGILTLIGIRERVFVKIA